MTRVQLWVRNLQGSLPDDNTGGAPITRVTARASSVVVSVSPMLGLLGTVTGMIKVFQVVEVQGADGAPPYLVRWSDGHEGLGGDGHGPTLPRRHAGGRRRAHARASAPAAR